VLYPGMAGNLDAGFQGDPIRKTAHQI